MSSLDVLEPRKVVYGCRFLAPALPRLDSDLVGKDVPAELDEESVVVTLVRVFGVVMRP